MKKLLLLSLVIMSTTVVGDDNSITRLSSRSVQSHPSLGRVCLSHKAGQFTVFHEGKSKKVAREDSDPMLRNLDAKELAKFLAVGKIRVNRYDNGDYKLNAYGTVEGGGPWAAWYARETTRFTGYAGLAYYYMNNPVAMASWRQHTFMVDCAANTVFCVVAPLPTP